MDELIELERAGWAALCDGSADDFYGRAMTEDALMVLANGTVMSRADVVTALGASPPWSSYEMADVRVVRISDDVAALVYVGTGHRAGGEPSFTGLMSSVYVRRDGDWKLALYQQT